MNHLTIYKHRVSRIRHWASCGENPTLVHFRHFSSLLTIEVEDPAPVVLKVRPLDGTESIKNNKLCKTNPILSAVGGLQMNVTSFITKYYENKWQRRVRKNKPNQTQYKANQSQYKANQSQYKANQSQYKANQTQNKPKTNPIKPNSLT